MSTLSPSDTLDRSWYDRFEASGSFEAYEYLDGDKELREKQKNAFIMGESDNPDLDYPQIDTEKLIADEKGLLLLKKDILSQERNETVRQLYRWRINEKIAELRILLAAARADMNRFRRYAEFVYGKPSPEVFAYTVQSLKNKLSTSLESDDVKIREAAAALNEVLPSDLPAAPRHDLPSEEEISNVTSTTLKEMGQLLNLEFTDKDRTYTAEEIREVFQKALETLRADGWTVVIDTSSKTGISVNQEEKAIKIPQTRKLSLGKLQTLIAHEVGTHVTRRIKGERSRLKLLGLGLDRYERGDEGVARMREQALGGKVNDFAGLEGHLAISLAYGLDGKPRNFRQVYDVMEKYFYFLEVKKGKSEHDSLAAARENAWKRTVRTFRGTDCRTAGTCFTKDIIYREGNIGAWEVVRSNPDEMLRFSVGKYDPANPRHIWVLDQLGISDQDLE